jgi:hypothetical protein
MKKTFGIALVVAVLALIIDSWLRDAEAAALMLDWA